MNIQEVEENERMSSMCLDRKELMLLYFLAFPSHFLTHTLLKRAHHTVNMSPQWIHKQKHSYVVMHQYKHALADAV